MTLGFQGVISFRTGHCYVPSDHPEWATFYTTDELLAKGLGGAGVTSTGFAVGYSANGCQFVNDDMGYGDPNYVYIAFKE